MDQLTGWQLGTDQASTFLGSVSASSTADIDAAGIYYAFIQALNGNNLIQSSTESISLNGQALAIGIQSAGIVTGIDHDTITVWSQSTGSVGLSYGGRQAFIFTDAGDDIVTLSANTLGTTAAQAWGLAQASIISGLGGDSLTLSGSATAINPAGSATTTGYGAQNAFINSGSDIDQIALTGTASLDTSTGGSSTGYGLYLGSVNSGDGNDLMAMSGIAVSLGQFGQTTVLGAGLANGYLTSEAGNDQIFVTGSASRDGAGTASGYGLMAATIETGSGSDLLAISGTGTDIGVGAWQATINTGDDDDSFYLVGESAGYGVGLWETTVDTGSGNDVIMISGSNLSLNQSYVLAGAGDDWLDVGYGSGGVDGGEGYDVLIFDFFDASSMLLTPLDNGGLRLDGSLDAAGNQTTWSQDIYNVEAYQLDGQLLSEAQVIDLYQTI